MSHERRAEEHARFIGPQLPDSELDGVLMYRRVWGDISEETARSFGAVAGCRSALVRPMPTADLQGILQRVDALLPTSMRPNRHTTPASLAKELEHCEYLDDIHVLKGGCGKDGRRVRLNATKYPQPRRVTYSVLAATEDDANDSDSNQRSDSNQPTVKLFAYTQHGRDAGDWRCRLMPDPICDLMIYLHKFALGAGLLSGWCKERLPTACQLMCYYTAFQSKVTRHRDNWCTEDLVQHLEHGTTSTDIFRKLEGHTASIDTNSQMVGSDVMIWTMGNTPMRLTLSFPNPNNRYGNRDTYIMHPKFMVPCSHGTLFVFAAVDDLFFCHEACFEQAILECFGNGGYRFAYVFRWLKSAREFYTNPEKKFAMKVPEALQQRYEERHKLKRKQKCGYR